MTSAVSAHRVPPPMTHNPDPAAPSQAQAVDDAVEAPTIRSRLREEIAENPLLSLFFGLIVALLTFFGTLTVGILLFFLNDLNDGQDSLGERIDRVEVSLGERIDRLDQRIDGVEAKMDAGFAAQGAQIAELDARLTAQIAELDARLTAQIAELDRKLTGLVAHLNATEAVEAALEHRLLIPGDSTPEPKGEPSS